MVRVNVPEFMLKTFDKIGAIKVFDHVRYLITVDGEIFDECKLVC